MKLTIVLLKKIILYDSKNETFWVVIRIIKVALILREGVYLIDTHTHYLMDIRGGNPTRYLTVGGYRIRIRLPA